jgi:hypothetical protein
MEQAQALVRKEYSRQSVMLGHVGMRLAGGINAWKRNDGLIGDRLRGENMGGLKIKHVNFFNSGQKGLVYLLAAISMWQPIYSPNKNNSQTNNQSKDRIGYTHYGNFKHTHDTCFKIYGYSDWWKNLKIKKHNEKSNRLGRVALVNIESEPVARPMVDSPNPLFGGSSTLSDSGNCALALLSTNHNDCSD